MLFIMPAYHWRRPNGILVVEPSMHTEKNCNIMYLQLKQ